MQTHGNITRLHPVTRQPDSAFDRAVREHLEQVLCSARFDASARSREFLRFAVDETLAGRSAGLTQATIAVTVFGRGADFDPILDPIVRVQAGRLRRSLERYYLLCGGDDSVRIELQKGRYAPVFITPAAAEPTTATPPQLAPQAADLSLPAIVIHPFKVTSPEGDDAAARLADELTMELNRHGDVRVVRQRDLDRLDLRQQTSIRFELHGSLRDDGEDSRVIARLVDRTTAEQVWSDEYRTDRACQSLSRSFDDIARVIAARIGAEHGVMMRLLAGERNVASVGGSHALVHCHRFFIAHQLEELPAALQAMQEATAREPQLALPWAYLSRLYVANYSFELTELHTPIEKAIEYAHQGVMLDPASARLRCALASALLIKGELATALSELEQALRLNSHALAHREIIGWLLALAGDWDRGMTLLRDAMARNPYSQMQARHGLWADHLRCGQYEAACLAAFEYLDCGSFWRTLMMACCLGHLKRTGEARAAAAELLLMKPQFAERGRMLIGHYIKEPELHTRIVDGLDRAGLLLR